MKIRFLLAILLCQLLFLFLPPAVLFLHLLRLIFQPQFKGKPAYSTVATSGDKPNSLAKVGLAKGFGRLPLSFEVNQGQTNAEVKFLSRGKGYTLFLTPNEAVLSLKRGQDTSGMPDLKSVASLPKSQNS